MQVTDLNRLAILIENTIDVLWQIHALAWPKSKIKRIENGHKLLFMAQNSQIVLLMITVCNILSISMLFISNEDSLSD